MSVHTRSPQSITLKLPRSEQWTLHHILLDRIDQELTAPDTTSVDPPAVEIYQAFEILETGSTRFTNDQFEAMQEILAEYHHSSPDWEVDRPQIESLLDRIADIVSAHS